MSRLFTRTNTLNNDIALLALKVIGRLPSRHSQYFQLLRSFPVALLKQWINTTLTLDFSQKTHIALYLLSAETVRTVDVRVDEFLLQGVMPVRKECHFSETK